MVAVHRRAARQEKRRLAIAERKAETKARLAAPVVPPPLPGPPRSTRRSKGPRCGACGRETRWQEHETGCPRAAEERLLKQLSKQMRSVDGGAAEMLFAMTGLSAAATVARMRVMASAAVDQLRLSRRSGIESLELQVQGPEDAARLIAELDPFQRAG